MIGAELADFLRDGLGIHIGTRDEHLNPNGARAAAVEVEADGLHLVLYIADVAAARVLPDLRSNGEAAVVFARPTDDRACQVKGTFIEAHPAGAEAHGFVLAQWDRFLSNLERIGVPRGVPGNWIVWPAVAVRLRATAVFDQTPGPGAGAPFAHRP